MPCSETLDILPIKLIAHYYVIVRTTLTLDDDIAESLKKRAQLLNISFEQVVNYTLRRGLAPSADRPPSAEYRVVPNRSGFVPGVDPLKLNQL